MEDRQPPLFQQEIAAKMKDLHFEKYFFRLLRPFHSPKCVAWYLIYRTYTPGIHNSTYGTQI